MNAPSRFLTAAALVTFVPVIFVPAASRADVHPAALFGDNMVLQRDMTIPVWGMADPSEKVTVTLANKSASTAAGADGRWRVNLGAIPAGGPYTLTIAGKNTVTAANVLMGDVWLCSGQSNMQFSVGWHKEYFTADIAASDDPSLRSFTVANVTSPQPVGDLIPNRQQTWVAASPQTVGGFTAVGYFFARELRRQLHVPIGIIHSSWGGTNGESWVSRQALSAEPELKTLADTQIQTMESLPSDEQQFPSRIAAWENQYGAKDAGNTGEALGWAKPDFNDADWKTAKAPLNLSQIGMPSGGSAWFRKTVDLPADAAGKAFTWNLNWIADDDTAYFNGVPLSPVGQPQPQFYTAPRAFVVPGDLVHAGQNTLALRVFSHGGGGTTLIPLQSMGIPLAAFGPDADEWRYQAEHENPPLSADAVSSLPKSPAAQLQNTATYIYNAQIAPLIPFAIKGVVWYQGENNAQRAMQYRKILPALIADWRSRWGEGNFPFYIVQLANYGGNPPQPGRSGWAELREAQLLTAEKVPNTGLAVTIDVGEGDNIHPKDKQDVGKRLALNALAKTYGRPVEYSGPIYSSLAVMGGKIKLSFTHAGGGLVAKGGPLKYFAIAGPDHQYVWGDAVISGNSVLVSSPQVPNPVSVRYAWADDPEGCNLYNAAGLPASPFRTDLADDAPALASASQAAASQAAASQTAASPVPASALKKSGLLLNGDFSSPAVPADKTYLVAHADGWTYDAKNSGPAIGVQSWKPTRPPYLLWNDPDGTVSQTADVKTHPIRAGKTYTLAYTYGGQGKGSYTLVTSILAGGKVAATDTKVVDVTKPGIDKTGTLSYTAPAADAGKSLGVSFTMTEPSGEHVQSALVDVSLSADAPTGAAHG